MDTQELEKLYSLKEKGIITEEQFNLKKQQILNVGNSIKKDCSGMKKFSFYFLSFVSFLFLWGMFAFSVIIVNRRLNSKIILTASIIYITLLLLFMLCRFFSKKLHHKLISAENGEKFLKSSKIYSKSMSIITILLLVIFVGIDIKDYLRNNRTEYEYYENGQIKSKIQYKSGWPAGIIETYYESGAIKSQTDCNGKFSIGGFGSDSLKVSCADYYEVKEYYENGQLAGILRKKDVIEQKDFLRDGPFANKEDLIAYYENGKLKSISHNNESADIFYSNDFFLLQNFRHESHSSNTATIYMLFVQCTYDGKLIDFSNSNNIEEDEKRATKLCEEYSNKIKEENK